MSSLFVHDGWTVKGRVPAVEGLHPAVVFTYRPATPRLRYEFQRADEDLRLEAACALLCRQLVGVRVEGEAAELKITPTQAETMHADVFQAMFDTVMGYAGPNVKTEDAEKN